MRAEEGNGIRDPPQCQGYNTRTESLQYEATHYAILLYVGFLALVAILLKQLGCLLLSLSPFVVILFFVYVHNHPRRY